MGSVSREARDDRAGRVKQGEAASMNKEVGDEALEVAADSFRNTGSKIRKHLACERSLLLALPQREAPGLARAEGAARSNPLAVWHAWGTFSLDESNWGFVGHMR